MFDTHRRQRRARASARPSSRERLSAVVPQGTEAVTGAHRRQGERRRDQGELQDRRHRLRDLRRHRAVRRLVHHLEHLHDDRHPALAGDRAAAGDRRPPAPGPAQPAARGARPRASPPRRSGSASASLVAKGLKAADGRRRARPAVHRAAGRAAAPIWVSLLVGTRGHRRRPPWSRPAGPPRCCRSRRCASRRRAPRSRRGGAPSSGSRSSRPAPRGMLAALYGGAGMKVFGLGLLAATGRRDGRAAARGASAGLGDRGPAAAARLPGELAKQNATRNPRRTSATAAALMIGLTLVVSMGVFASSLKASFGDVIADQTNADLYVATSSAQAPGLQPVGDRRGPGRAGRRRGLGQRLGPGPLRGRAARASRRSTRPRPSEVMNLHVSQGSIADLGTDGVVVAKAAATAHGWQLGDTVHGGVRGQREAPAARGRRLRRQGLDRRRLHPEHRPAERLRRPAARVDRARHAVAPAPTGTPSRTPSPTALADHPDAQVLDQEGYEKVASGFIDQLLDLRDRDAGAGRADRPAGHRQHAGAVGLRAHP